MQLSSFESIYLASWSALVLTAALLLIRTPGDFALLSLEYRKFLSQRWKVGTFVTAFVGINLLAPISGDPTWDFVDASFMAALTFATAPWAVGILFRRWQWNVGAKRGFVATVIWLFSASWSYDLYLLLRDGYYPVTWSANLIASSTLYFSAGIFWNLAWNEENGTHLAFTRDNWPVPDNGGFRRIAPYALPLIIAIGLIFLLFPVVFFTGWRPW